MLDKNELHYGDNLKVMREKIPDEVADLIYLDPPFNSARNYNLLFKQVKGDSSPAQIMAFEDTWHWSPLLYEEFKEEPRNAKLFGLVAALYEILGPSEMMAYVLMMAPRLLELHRKLKPTGSFYLHCDPVASHYLKIILDVVFGPQNFRNEITWKRTSAHNDARRKYADIADNLLFYSKGNDYNFQVEFLPSDEEYLRKFYKYVEPETGRRFALDNITSPNPRPNLTYEWQGFEPPKFGWRYSRETMDKQYEEGRIVFSNTMRPRVKRYADELRGTPTSCIWDDIMPVQAAAAERRGYPTQKPLALLERIIAASSNPGDVVMDPFCGCGTAIVAAERMGRKWIGIDVTYLAIAEVVHRLNAECHTDRPLEYSLIGSPTDADGAAKLFEETAPQNHKPFEQFCVSLVAGEYREKRGADRGIDGVLHLWDTEGKLCKVVLQVKGGNALTLSALRDFASVIKDNDAVMGLMIAMREPTKEMQLVCEQQGKAQWLSSHKYPKLQIRTVKQLLENPKALFDIPESYRVQRTKGIGKAQPGQLSLEEKD